MEQNKKQNEEKKTSFPEMNEKEFLLEILTEFVSLRSLIYDGRVIPAWKSVQKVSDKVKARIKIL